MVYVSYYPDESIGGFGDANGTSPDLQDELFPWS